MTKPRRAFWFALCALATVALTGCGPSPAQLTLRVQIDDAVTVNPAALKIIVHTAGDLTPRIVDPVALAELGSLDLLVEVEFGESFYLDVWGCRTLDNCGDDGGRIARGCSAVRTVSEGEQVIVPVTLLEDDVGTAECDAVEL